MNDFQQLLERLRRVEALHARTDVAGERDAAANALNAIRATGPLPTAGSSRRVQVYDAGLLVETAVHGLAAAVRDPALSLSRPAVHDGHGQSLQVVRRRHFVARIC